MIKFSNLLPHCVGCLSGGGEVFFIIALDMPFVTWHGICFLLIENERIEDYAVVMARLYTGRMHQIRVHLYSKGFFMVGDKIYGKYGPKVFDDFIEKGIIPENFFNRQALHAYSLKFNHPITDEIIKVKAPLPKDLKELIKKIKNNVKNK